jgi:hypothetical protein
LDHDEGGRGFFSHKNSEYAFGELDDEGKRDLAYFAVNANPSCRFEFMQVEGRLYFVYD